MTGRPAAGSGPGAPAARLAELGREQAVTALFRVHHRRLVALARPLVEDLATAEDVVQEAYAALYRRWRWLRDKDVAPAHLDRAVLGAARTRPRPRRTAAGDVTLRYDVAGADVPAVDADDRRMAAVLATLPRRQREVLVLRYLLDRSDGEIAETLGISRGAVTQRARRGVARVAARLGDGPVAEPGRTELLLADAFRRQAQAATAATDTDRELERFTRRRGRRRGRRRWPALAAAGIVVAAAAVLGLPADAPPPQPVDGREDRPPSVDLDRVPVPASALDPVPASAADAPVAVPDVGTVVELGRDPTGRLWMLRQRRSALEWSLDPLPAPGSPVTGGTGLVAQSRPWVALTDDVAVVAVPAGGPLPGARDFLSRRDGLLRVDLSSGSVLGFTPVQDAASVAAAPDGTVWAVTAPDTVVQLDPRSGRTLRTLQPPGLVDRLGVAGGSLWLVAWTRTPSLVHQLDLPSGQPVRTLRLAHASIPVVVGDAVLLPDRDGRILRVPADGEPTGRRLAVSGPVDDVVGADDTGVWLQQGSTVVRVDADTLTVQHALTLPWQGPYAIAGDGEDAILVADVRAGTLRRVPLPLPGSDPG